MPATSLRTTEFFFFGSFPVHARGEIYTVVDEESDVQVENEQFLGLGLGRVVRVTADGGELCTGALQKLGYQKIICLKIKFFHIFGPGCLNWLFST